MDWKEGYTKNFNIIKLNRYLKGIEFIINLPATKFFKRWPNNTMLANNAVSTNLNCG